MEKTLLALTFLLLNSLLCLATQMPNPVHDIDGNQLRNGTLYYILPVVRGSGGGVTRGTAAGVDCPLTAVQAKIEADPGIPVYFTPVNPKEGVIRVSTDLNVMFRGDYTFCMNSGVWRLQLGLKQMKYVIETDGVEGNPGNETLYNWFKIEEYESDYKLVFCPTVCSTCKPICQSFGIYIEYGLVETRRLVLSDDKPFMVFFKKAP